MSAAPDSCGKPGWLAPVAFVCAVLLAAGWSATRLLASRASAQEAAQDLSTCRDLAERIGALRERPAIAGLGAARATELSRRIEAAVRSAGVPEDAVDRIEPQPSRRVGETSYKETPVQVRLRPVTMEQLFTFLHALASEGAGMPGLRLKTIRCSAPRGEETGDRWSVESTLTSLAYDPETQSAERRCTSPRSVQRSEAGLSHLPRQSSNPLLRNERARLRARARGIASMGRPLNDVDAGGNARSHPATRDPCAVATSRHRRIGTFAAGSLRGLLCAAALQGCAPAHPPPPPKDYETLTRDPRRDAELARQDNARALAMIDKGDYAGAETALKAALEADLTCGPAHNNLGKIYFHQGKLYLAAWEFQYAMKLMPNQPEPPNNLGLVFEAVGKLDDAADSYGKAMAMEPENVQVLGNLTRAKIRRGDHDDAVRGLLAKLILREIRPDWLAWEKATLVRLETARPEAPAATRAEQ